MNLSEPNQLLQYASWFLTVLELTAALYILALNARHTANRYVGVLLILEAAVNFGTGQLIGAAGVNQTGFVTYLLVVVAPAVSIWLLLTTLILLKPEWTRGRWRWLTFTLHFLALLPAALTLIDYFWGVGLWYTGLGPTYMGGYARLAEFADGALAPPIRILTLSVIPALTIIPILYVLFFDKRATPLTRRLAWLLLTAQVLAIGVEFGLRGWIAGGAAPLITGLIFALAYSVAGFSELISAPRFQRGTLRGRLTLMVFSISVPILVAVSVFVSAQAGALISQFSEQQLRSSSVSLQTNVLFWLDFNVKALRQLTLHPDTISMDPERQLPYLQSMVAAYPDITLVSVEDLIGVTVARSDGKPVENFNDQLWFQLARLGNPVVYETAVDPDTQRLSLIVAMPIRDSEANLVGVGMFATQVGALREQVRRFELGEGGVAYVVDSHDVVVAHSDPAMESRLVDLSPYPPVIAARQGERGLFTFTDPQGVRWLSYIDVTAENQWVIVIQQPESAWLAERNRFQRGALVVLGVGLSVLLFLIGVTLNQALRPIQTLTETATAIAAGDLARTAPVESEDELGLLANTFNSMTSQLRGLIEGLEQRIEERTQDLAQRSLYLEASAQVARAAASILDVEQLIRQTVVLIQERFNLYYVGLFLVDESGEWAVLRAGTGEAGHKMLSRGHRIRVGAGMIGWSVTHAESRVASEVADDEVRQVNPDLPDTRSEAALPLRSRGRVVGALTVQSDRPGVFDPDTIVVLQLMADQVAVAIDNATLYVESQRALESMQSAYGEFSRRAWVEFLNRSRTQGYLYTGRAMHEITGEPWGPEMLDAVHQGQSTQSADGMTLLIPVKVRGQIAGVLRFSKKEAGDFWTEDEKNVLANLVDQLGVALESAQLYQEAQARAQREQLVGVITANVRAEVEVDAVLERALEELARALGARRATVQLEVEE